MEITDRHIVAIDLGTTKLAVTVARVTGLDVQIIYYKESPSAGIRYSSVFHVTQAAEALSKAIREAEEALEIKITQAVVGMPKFPVRQESNTAKVDKSGEEIDITLEVISELKRFAQSTYPLQNPEKEAIYGAVAQSFSDGENFQIIENDIIGMTSDVLDGNFKIFIGKKSELNKIDTAMNKAGLAVSRKFFTADSTAKAVLTDAEMENGVALIDFGAGSTSVSIYHGNIMRHYASIPFGGKSISNDIKTECLISERLAENIKLAYGACMPEKLQNLSEKIIHIRSNSAEPDSQLPVKYLSEIITARVEEIMMAILYEIQESGFADMLRSGIVVTGGCAQTANLNSFLFELSGYKVRTGYPRMLFSGQNCDGINDTSAATSIGLVYASLEENINCCQKNVEKPEGPAAEEEEEEDRDMIFSEEEMKEMETPQDPAPSEEARTKGRGRKKNSNEKDAENNGEKQKWYQGLIKWTEEIKKDIEKDNV